MPEDLRGLCDQFEQVMLASLLPASVFSVAPTDPNRGEPALGGADRDLFAQAFAAAFERAGGMGLGRALLQDLDRTS